MPVTSCGGAALELVEGRWLAVDRPVRGVLAHTGRVQAGAERVEDVALDDVTDGHRDGRAGVADRRTTDQTVGRLHRDGPDDVVTQVQRDLQGQDALRARAGHVTCRALNSVGDAATREFDVDDGADDPDDPAGGWAVLGRLRS